MPAFTLPDYKIGETIGRLQIIGEPFRKNGRWYYPTECACGNRKEARYNHLKDGRSLSCGCYNREITAKRNHKHGFTKRGNVEPLFKRWAGMKQRCEDEHCDRYKWYGGRGITVCDQWQNYQTFRDWALANGYKPDLEIDRKNNDGNYEPSNCHWVTHAVNASNPTSYGKKKRL